MPDITFSAVHTFQNIRPVDIPTDWPIFNTSRPLYGHHWIGDFLCGVHYAVISPDEYRPEQMAEENRKLDAHVVIQHTTDEAREWLTEYIAVNGYHTDPDMFEERRVQQLFLSCNDALLKTITLTFPGAKKKHQNDQ